MKIYLDIILIINSLFDFLILFGVKTLLKEKASIKRLILGSIIGNMTLILLFISINKITLFIYKLLVSCIIIIVSFGKNNFIKDIIYFYLISIILGGSIYLINNNFSYVNNGLLFINNGYILNILIIIILFPIIIYLYVKEHKEYKNIYNYIYNVFIYINNNKYNLKGMIDTGNELIDPYKKRKIIIINNNIKINTNNLSYIYVPYKALNTSGIIKCFKTDYIMINNKKINNILIGISNDNIYLNNVDCILPNIIREEIWLNY